MTAPLSARAVVSAIAALFALAIAPAGPAGATQNDPQLIDQTGRSFTLSSLRDRPLVITFVSAHCTDACPLIDAQFSDAARRIARRHLSARLLTITLDPDRDSPADMRALATRFEADPRYWLVAAGRRADVDRILADFSVVAKPGKSGYREAHTTFVYVFDGRGQFAKTMLASTGLNDDIVAAVTSLQVARR